MHLSIIANIFMMLSHKSEKDTLYHIVYLIETCWLRKHDKAINDNLYSFFLNDAQKLVL